MLSFLADDFKLKSQHSSTAIGTLSTDVQIFKKTTPYRDWNTGGQRTRVDYSTSFSMETLSKEINKKYPQLLTYPDILDAQEIGKNDFLILLAKDSQGSFYPLIHVYKTEDLNFDLIDLNGQGSSRSLFLPSPSEKWTSLKGYNDEQFLIQHSPFKVINLGIAELVKMDANYAYTASTYDSEKKRYEQDLLFQIASLNNGTEKARLVLPQKCFRLPRFLLDQKNYNIIDSEDDSVTFEKASIWWDETISAQENGTEIKMDLKSTHKLKSAKQQVLSIYPTFSDQNSEIDKIKLIADDCLKLNPNGAALSLAEKYPEELAASAFEACFTNMNNLPSDFVKNHCKNKTESTIFKTKNSSIVKIAFTYFNPTTKSQTKSDGYKLTLNNNVFFYLSEREGELNLIANVFVLSHDKVLILARGTGPWNTFLLSDSSGTSATLNYLTDFPFLSDSEENSIKSQLGEWLGEHKYVYFSNSGFLFRKDGSFLRINHILDVKDIQSLSLTKESENEFKIHLLDLSKSIDNPYSPAEVFQKTFTFKSKCTAEFKGNISQYSYHYGNKWFQEHFHWDQSSALVTLLNKCE